MSKQQILNKPLISVIIPAHDNEQTVENSVRSIMNQSYTNIEILITDDCSIDSTYDILKRLALEDKRIQLLKNEVNLKLPKTLNKMIKLCRGKYIARMDSDDISRKNRIQEQVLYMETHPEIGICGTNAWNINNNGRIKCAGIIPISNESIQNAKYFENVFYHPSVMIVSDLLKENLYNEDFQYSQDYELWFRLLKITKGHNLNKKLLFYRLPEKATKEKLEKQKKFAESVQVKYSIGINNLKAMKQKEKLPILIQVIKNRNPHNIEISNMEKILFFFSYFIYGLQRILFICFNVRYK